MLFKLRVSIGLGLFACVLTMAVCLIHNTRPYTILYRTVITFLFFCICGFWIGRKAEIFYNQLKSESFAKGQKVDIVSENKQSETAETDAPTGFTPVTSANLPHLTRPKQ